MAEPVMRLVGNEDGEVVIECRRPECMVPGPPHRYNPEGRYLLQVPLFGANLDPQDVAIQWEAHLTTHAP